MENPTAFTIPENDPHKARKEAAVKFLSLIAAGKPKEGLKSFVTDCKTHNPYTAGGMDALTDAMIAVQKQGSQGILKGSTADFKLAIRQVLADGDLVAVHTQLPVPTQVKAAYGRFIFSVSGGDKIVEYWDITQMVPQNAPNAAGAFS